MEIFEITPRGMLEIVVRSSLVYLALLGLFRLGGKRELGHMSVFDFVVILIVANAVQNAMIGPDLSLTGGVIAAATLILVDRAATMLGFHYKVIGRSLAGTPTLLVHDGELIEPHLRREGITDDQVMMAIREHGIDTLSGVRSAVLEVDGAISVIPADQPVQPVHGPPRGGLPKVR